MDIIFNVETKKKENKKYKKQQIMYETLYLGYRARILLYYIDGWIYSFMNIKFYIKKKKKNKTFY
jgi:hypothetical protein